MSNTTSPTLTHPIVHLNGSGADALRTAYLEAYEAVVAARTALERTAPHGRDYYPLGDAAMASAQTQHRARWAALETVKDELFELARALR